MPDDLAPLLARHGITGTILVQAAPTIAETRFLLDVARATPFVRGVVGWVDFEAADAADTIATLAADPLLVGLRPMVQDIADDDWLLRPSLAPALDAMVRARTRVRRARAAAPPAATEDADRTPSRSRGCHRSWRQAAIRDGVREPWAGDLAAIAAVPGVTCKLSGPRHRGGSRMAAYPTSAPMRSTSLQPSGRSASCSARTGRS